MSALTISLIQSDLHWEDKSANLAMFSGMINGIQQKTEIVLLPEMFSTGFSLRPESLAETMQGETVRWMKDTAAEKKIILAGSLIIEAEGRYFNRLVWMLPNGELGYYDKRHLFGFADETKHYTAGTRRFVASVNGWRVNLLVCYDLRFPVWARQAGDGAGVEYDLLVCVANWPQSRIAAWNALLPARAIENQCYVAAVNRVGDDGNNIHYSGDSVIIDPLGEPLCRKTDKEDVLTVTLHKEKLTEIRNKFPFLADADQFKIEP